MRMMKGKKKYSSAISYYKRRETGKVKERFDTS